MFMWNLRADYVFSNKSYEFSCDRRTLWWKCLEKNVDSCSLIGVLVGVAADFYIAGSKEIFVFFGFFLRLSSPDPPKPYRGFEKPLGHACGPSGFFKSPLGFGGSGRRSPRKNQNNLYKFLVKFFVKLLFKSLPWKRVQHVVGFSLIYTSFRFKSWYK